MKIIKVRSPFFVTVNETGQTGSKVELFIWNKGTTEPSIPTYTLSKLIPSATQLKNNYNISNYIREFINPIKAALVDLPTEEDNNNWAICKVKRYKLVGTTYTLLDIIEYVCIDAFTFYNEGQQLEIEPSASAPALVLNNRNIISTYPFNGYLNIICQKQSDFSLYAVYLSQTGAVIGGVIILNADTSDEYFNFKVPFKWDSSTDEYQTLFLSYDEIEIFEKTTIKIEECKYNWVNCSFVNRYGGWEFLTFFKQQTNTITTKGTDYKLMPQDINYNVSIGQTQRININGSQTVKLNTGYVDENYSELIFDLLLSETVLLDDKPVTLKTQTSDLKTVLKDRMINYEIEFEYAYGLINDVI